MAVKQTGQMSLAEALIGGGAGAGGMLDRIASLVDWERFEPLLGGRDRGGPGRPGWPARVLFRALVLQSAYGLSVRQLEEALADRLSFRRFCGLGLQEDVPDHTVLNRFHSALVAQGLLEGLLAELDRQLDEARLILRQGTMVDATLVPAAAAPGKGAGRGGQGAGRGAGRGGRASQDPDAAFGGPKRRGRQTFGYKAHVGVDAGSGLIRRVITTPANVPDTVPADRLIAGDEAAVWADAAYHTQARAAGLKAAGIKPRLARRPNRHHPVLPPRLQRYNLLIARRRAAVETTFATLKNRMGLTRIRYIGLAKAAAQITLAAFAFNLRRWAALTA